MSEDYWDGATWVYHSQIAHEAAQGAGTISWLVVPGAGNEMEVLYGHLRNTDTVDRSGAVTIEDDAGAEIVSLQRGTITAAVRAAFPVAPAASSDESGGGRYIVSGTMRLLALVAAVADGQESEFGLACRIRGGVPTVTESGQGTIVITDLTEQVY